MHILVVDDDAAIRESLRRTLAFNGYTVDVATNGEEAVHMVEAANPNLLVLDVMMPRKDGLQVCRDLRASGWKRPILLLTARDAVADRVAGLDAGADDYLPKPFALEELLARIRSLLRRATLDPNAESRNTPQRLTLGDLTLTPQTHRVTRGDRIVPLTRTEYQLLQVFLEHPREVLERKAILEQVWGEDFPATGNALEVYIGYLRKKLEANGESRLIHTVRGVGYILREDDE